MDTRVSIGPTEAVPLLSL